MLKRQTAAADVGGVVDLSHMPGELLVHRDILDFLTLAKWPVELTPRTTGTVLLFCDAQGLKAMLNDRDQGLVAFITLSDDGELLEQLNGAVCSQTTDWRKAKPYTPPKGK